MVWPELLRFKSGKGNGNDSTETAYTVPLLKDSESSESDTEEATFTKAPKANGMAEIKKKWITCVVVILVAAGLTLTAVGVHIGSLEAEKYECNLNLHKDFHKGNIIRENGSRFAKIQCEEGHKLNGSSVIECLPSGHWSQTPTCIPKECKALPVPEYSEVVLKTINSSIVKEFTVSCHDGFLLEGNKTVICLPDETWSPVPVCFPVDCGDPPKVDKGKIKNLRNTTYNNTYSVECNEGYNLENGNETVTCEADGKWDKSPKCVPVPCGLPSSPNHATIATIEGTVFGQSITFKCLEGFEMTYSPRIICQSNGKWSSFPVCTIVNCGTPPDIKHGRVRYLRDTVYGSTVDIGCDYGYTLSGSRTVKCESNGRWSALPVCIQVTCGAPDIPLNAYTVDESERSVTFTCWSGYHLRGYPTVTCQESGEWSTYPSCEYIRDLCSSNPCYPQACVSSGYSYRCTSSYTASSGCSGIFSDTFFRTLNLWVFFLAFRHLIAF